MREYNTDAPAVLNGEGRVLLPWIHGPVFLFTSGTYRSTIFHMKNPALLREALEDLWRERMQIAMNRYRIAKVACADAIAEQADSAPPDGSFAYRQALRVETAALVEYRRVLLIFTDLVANRKMPREE